MEKVTDNVRQWWETWNISLMFVIKKQKLVGEHDTNYQVSAWLK